MPRTKLTGQDKKNFIKAKIWWATGDVGVALMAAVDTANKNMANKIRERSKNAIKKGRGDNNPFPRDELAKTTGQFKKGSVARAPGKPPKFYRRNSLHIIRHGQSGSKGSRMVTFKNPKNIVTYRYKPWFTGPIRGGGVSPKYFVSGKTVARKVELGGVQRRKWRKVPAIKQRGNRNATWDGEYRWEFHGAKKTPSPDSFNLKNMRYLMMSKKDKGLLQYYIDDNGKRRLNWKGQIDIPWKTQGFKQTKRPYMALGMRSAMKERRKVLDSAKQAFPKFARKFVKFSARKGFYI